MTITKKLIKKSAHTGIQKGFSGYFWMLRILIPISFFTLILDYSGMIRHLDFLLTPVMGFLSLPSVAALPIIVGLFTGIYGAVAAMMVLPLTLDEMTLIAIFLLISHNLINEGIIQSKAGIRFMKATLFRLSASVITVIISARFMDLPVVTAAPHKSLSNKEILFSDILGNWTLDMLMLSIKIFIIIMTIMILLEIMKTLQIIPRITRLIKPLLTLMGLNQNMGILWLTANLFGIAYGGAVIVEEVKENTLSKDELTRLHLSIGINHAVIEDPALFIPLGIGVFWLWIPRLIAAIVCVQLLNLWSLVRKRKIQKPVSEAKL